MMLVDDHAVLRLGLANLIGDDPGMTVVGEAGSCAETLELMAKVRPDVVVLDVRLPDGSGIDLIQPIKGMVEGARVVILTSHVEDALVLAALRMGADGYLLKEVSAEELLAGLRRSIRSGVVSPATRRAGEAPGVGLVKARASELTGQEKRVCEHVGRGLSNREVAESTGLSEKTVRNYLTRAFEKLGIRRRTELVALSVARKLGRTG